MKLMVFMAFLFVLTVKEASVGWYIGASIAFIVDVVVSTAIYGSELLRKEK